MEEKDDKYGLLSFDQAAGLIMSLARSRGSKGFEEKEAQAVLEWGNQALVEWTAMGMVLDGKLIADVDPNGTVSFHMPSDARNDKDRAAIVSVIDKLKK